MRFQIIIGALVALFTGMSSFAADKVHHVAFHVDQNDPQIMNMTLNNVKNINKYYQAKGENVVVEVVAYGPGLMMYSEAKSPVKERIAAMALEISDLKFSACGNTHRKMSEKAGKKMELVSEAEIVPSGVVQLIALQEKGYSYVRP